MNQQVPPNKIAFIIDGEVVDVLHTDDRLAAIFLSDPEVVDVTSIYLNSPNPDINMTGWTYDGSNFAYPATVSSQPVVEITPEQDALFRQSLSEEELKNIDINNIPEGLWISPEENSN
jgi:hypothetical protein